MPSHRATPTACSNADDGHYATQLLAVCVRHSGESLHLAGYRNQSIYSIYIFLLLSADTFHNCERALAVQLFKHPIAEMTDYCIYFDGRAFTINAHSQYSAFVTFHTVRNVLASVRSMRSSRCSRYTIGNMLKLNKITELDAFCSIGVSQHLHM